MGRGYPGVGRAGVHQVLSTNRTMIKMLSTYIMFTMITISTSGFLTGVYGLWNIYIFALLFLYAPSHKAWANEDATSTTGGPGWELGGGRCNPLPPQERRWSSRCPRAPPGRPAR